MGPKKLGLLFFDQNNNVANRVARCFWMQHTKMGKIYQMTIKKPNGHSFFPKGRKIDLMAINYTNIFRLQKTSKFPQSGIFGLKIYHLATLVANQVVKTTALQCMYTRKNS
jgi:hypothetical protein